MQSPARPLPIPMRSTSRGHRSTSRGALEYEISVKHTNQESCMTTLTQPVESEMPSSALGHRWGSLLVLGIVQIIAGSIAIAIPVIASLAAVVMFGAVLIVSAVFQ